MLGFRRPGYNRAGRAPPEVAARGGSPGDDHDVIDDDDADADDDGDNADDDGDDADDDDAAPVQELWALARGIPWQRVWARHGA